MTPWQQANQIKYLIYSQLWAGTSDRVFGKVVVTARPKEIPRALGSILPLCIINVGEADHDQQQPMLITAHRWTVWSVCSNKFDAIGEAGVLGANRTTKSGGKGLLEVEEELLRVLHSKQSESGLSIYCRARSAVGAAVDLALGYVIFRSYTIETKGVTSQRYYHPASRLAASGGGGSVSLSWTLPPDRWDRFRVVLRRAAGGTAPSGPTDGTGVTLAGDLAASVVDSPGAGTFSYALFAQYDETDGKPDGTPATAEKTSAAVTVTVDAT